MLQSLVTRLFSIVESLKQSFTRHLLAESDFGATYRLGVPDKEGKSNFVLKLGEKLISSQRKNKRLGASL